MTDFITSAEFFANDRDISRSNARISKSRRMTGKNAEPQEALRVPNLGGKTNFVYKEMQPSGRGNYRMTDSRASFENLRRARRMANRLSGFQLDANSRGYKNEHVDQEVFAHEFKRKQTRWKNRRDFVWLHD